MDDLDEFMSEIDNSDAVAIPQQFDEVVDIVVDSERERAEQVEEAKEKFGEDSKLFEEAMAELSVDDANPFWKRLLEPEKAYGIDMNVQLAPVIE